MGMDANAYFTFFTPGIAVFCTAASAGASFVAMLLLCFIGGCTCCCCRCPRCARPRCCPLPDEVLIAELRRAEQQRSSAKSGGGGGGGDSARSVQAADTAAASRAAHDSNPVRVLAGWAATTGAPKESEAYHREFALDVAVDFSSVREQSADISYINISICAAS